MRKFLFSTGISILLIFASCLTSCAKKNLTSYLSDELEIQEAENPGTHKWYSFSNENFVEIEKPEYAVAAALLPWTEAVRISSFASGKNAAYATVNRLGILSFKNDKVSLSKDVSVFANRTAGNLFVVDGTPMFTVYKSAFFNDTIKLPEYKYDKSQHYFLVQYDLGSKICYPVINCNNLLEPPESEIVDYVWDGTNWLCNAKTISDGKIKFSYLNWMPTVSLTALSPVSAASGITVTESDKDTFRAAKEVEGFDEIPDAIRKLLSGLYEKVPLQVEVRTWNCSDKTYKNKAGNSRMTELHAKAAIGEGYSGAIFEDGTFYFQGYLEGHSIVREGRPMVLRLPKLPAGFKYTDFVISENTLYASWEETTFYRVSRSGFIAVNLDKTLYGQKE